MDYDEIEYLRCKSRGSVGSRNLGDVILIKTEAKLKNRKKRFVKRQNISQKDLLQLDRFSWRPEHGQLHINHRNSEAWTPNRRQYNTIDSICRVNLISILISTLE